MLEVRGGSGCSYGDGTVGGYGPEVLLGQHLLGGVVQLEQLDPERVLRQLERRVRAHHATDDAVHLDDLALDAAQAHVLRVAHLDAHEVHRALRRTACKDKERICLETREHHLRLSSGER